MKMNWQNIREKYPKAYKILEDNSDYFAALRLGVRGFDKRFLYDFFDEQGIYVNVMRWAETEAYFGLEVWSYRIIIGKGEFVTSEETYDSRTLAETEAFTKAFEILETK